MSSLTRFLQLLSLGLFLHVDTCGWTVPPCREDWFGTPCRYKCHCTNNTCDSNGECIESSTCEPGWFGPSCQYVDLVTTNTTSSTPTWVYDFPDLLCNPGQDTVTVSLQDTLYFTWLRLRTNITVSSQDFNFQLMFNDGSLVECSNMYTSRVSDTILDIHCQPGAFFQNLTITGDGVKYLCSVYISGGRNVALGQNTTQSSDYRNQKSSYAVDGDRNSNYDDESCTNTGDGDNTPTWTLTFNWPHHVNRYVLYNRNVQQERLQGFILSADLANQSMAFNYTDQDQTQNSIYTIQSRTPQLPVSRVNIVGKYMKDLYLTLCEVEMYGDVVCETGRYGRECNKTCNCDKIKDNCFVSTGGCPSGCAAGYQGEGCQNPCNATYYGTNCALSCSTNCTDQLCNATNGNCQSCVIGKSGLFCDEACPHTKFGEDCNQTCSRKCSSQLCDAVTGKCTSCVEGLTGDDCNQTMLSNEPGESLPVELIVGPVVAFVVVMITLIVIGVLIWGRRGHNKNVHEQTTPNTSQRLDTTPCTSQRLDTTPYTSQRFDDTDSIRPVGSNAETMEQYNTDTENSTYVVMKKPRGSRDNNASKMDHVDGVYYNQIPGRCETAIRFGDIDNFMTTHGKEFYTEQFKNIPANNNATTTAAQSPENINKNKYRNISAYDHSRVHLQTEVLKNHGDYINASYIDGFQQKKKFIASQGPTKIMLEDFVRMLWEQEAEVVVMLTNLVEDGKLKCEQYWPDDGEINIGEVTVKLTTTQVFADYTIRRLCLYKKAPPVHVLTYFHFTTWPDKDVPTTAWGLVDLEQRVASFSTSKPIVVHCSAGVGRTGTFIALHNILEEIKHTGYMDVFTTVQKLRQHRINMVQTSQQYEFLHKATQIAMVCKGTTVTTRNIRDRIQTLQLSESGQTNMEKEFKSVCMVCCEDEGNENEEIQENNTYSNSRLLTNRMKNRLDNVLPKEYYRPELRCETEEFSGYINAVLAPSCKKHDHQILTQLPLPTTVIDFWRLVIQYKVSLIVAFEKDLSTVDTSIGDYLPERDDETKTCSFLNIKNTRLHSSDAFDVHRITISVNEENVSNIKNNSFNREYRLSHLFSKNKDFDPKNLLVLMDKIRSMKPVGEGRTLFTCRNGAELSGLACTMSLLLDRMDNDQHVSVPLVVGTLKAIRPQIIPTLDQYRLLYQTLNLFNESNNDYSNVSTSPSSAPLEKQSAKISSPC